MAWNNSNWFFIKNNYQQVETIMSTTLQICDNHNRARLGYGQWKEFVEYPVEISEIQNHVHHEMRRCDKCYVEFEQSIQQEKSTSLQVA